MALPLKKGEVLLREMRVGGECILDEVVERLMVELGRGGGGNEGK